MEHKDGDQKKNFSLYSNQSESRTIARIFACRTEGTIEKAFARRTEE